MRQRWRAPKRCATRAASVDSLVASPFSKSMVKASTGPARMLAHHGQQGAGIDARAEEQAERHVAAQLQPHGILEQLLVFLDQGLDRPRFQRTGNPVPEALDFDARRARRASGGRAASLNTERMSVLGEGT